MELKKVISLLQDAEPVLHDPEKMTQEIMDHIRQAPRVKPYSQLQVFQRLLAAASIALLLIFGYEQFVIVQEIGSLERQISNTTTSNQLPDIRHLRAAVPYLNAGFSFTEIEQLFTGLKPRTLFKPATGSRVDKNIIKH